MEAKETAMESLRYESVAKSVDKETGREEREEKTEKRE